MCVSITVLRVRSKVNALAVSGRVSTRETPIETLVNYFLYCDGVAAMKNAVSFISIGAAFVHLFLLRSN